MAWIMNVLFVTLFSYAGWYAGEPFGTGAAIFLSLVGMPAGWLAGKRFMTWLNE